MKTFFNFLRRILSGELPIAVIRRYSLFLLFISGLALLWITNTYMARSAKERITKTEKELEIVKETLKSEKTKYINNTQPSQLIKGLAKDTIGMACSGTYKIMVDAQPLTVLRSYDLTVSEKKGGDNE